jgi:hypothetical protein
MRISRREAIRRRQLCSAELRLSAAADSLAAVENATATVGAAIESSLWRVSPFSDEIAGKRSAGNEDAGRESGEAPARSWP